MVCNPSGYFVIFPDRRRDLISLEHYANTGVLTTIIEGHTAAGLFMTAIGRKLVSRLDHSAYLGCQLACAEHALANEQHYVQGVAPEHKAPCIVEVQYNSPHGRCRDPA
jgi:tetrahydromethanopterin S-methyltransferase subunit A